MQNALKFGGITFGLVIVALILVFGGLDGWVGWRQHQFDNQEDTHDLADRAKEMATVYLEKRPRAATTTPAQPMAVMSDSPFAARRLDTSPPTPNGRL